MLSARPRAAAVDATKLDYVADLESALKSTGIPYETKEYIRHQIITSLRNKRPVNSTMKYEEQKAMKDLQNDDEIVALPADKGRMTVIMNKSDYIDKANTLHDDSETYQALDTNPSKTNCINQKLKQLKDKDKLNETTCYRVRPNDASNAKFYALPKIHKENIPLKPIVSLPSERLTSNDSWQSRTNLDKDDILELLNLCLSTEFFFPNSYYKQV